MTRTEIAEKFKHVKNKMPELPRKGDCFEIETMPIKQQLLGLGEGKQKIFFFTIKGANYEGNEPEINLELISEDVYISRTEY